MSARASKTPRRVYDEIVDQAWKDYMEIRTQAQKDYEEAEDHE